MDKSVEALWSIEFVSGVELFGAGVVVLETQHILGGDSAYYYVGNYNIVHNIVNADVEIIHYNGPKFSIFGTLDRFSVKLSGNYAYDTFYLTGHLVEDSTLKMAVRLTRRAELP